MLSVFKIDLIWIHLCSMYDRYKNYISSCGIMSIAKKIDNFFLDRGVAGWDRPIHIYQLINNTANSFLVMILDFHLFLSCMIKISHIDFYIINWIPFIVTKIVLFAVTIRNVVIHISHHICIISWTLIQSIT